MGTKQVKMIMNTTCKLTRSITACILGIASFIFGCDSSPNTRNFYKGSTTANASIRRKVASYHSLIFMLSEKELLPEIALEFPCGRKIPIRDISLSLLEEKLGTPEHIDRFDYGKYQGKEFFKYSYYKDYGILADVVNGKIVELSIYGDGDYAFPLWSNGKAYRLPMNHDQMVEMLGRPHIIIDSSLL